jgi:hypothetical protein
MTIPAAPADVASLDRPAASTETRSESTAAAGFFMFRLLELAFPVRVPGDGQVLREAAERAAPELQKLFAEAELRGRELERERLAEQYERQLELDEFQSKIGARFAEIGDELVVRESRLNDREAEITAREELLRGDERLAFSALELLDTAPAPTVRPEIRGLNLPGPAAAAVWCVAIAGTVACVWEWCWGPR